MIRPKKKPRKEKAERENTKTLLPLAPKK